MLQINTSHDVPDTTYFRTESAEPVLKGDALTIYNGTGTRRSSWGQPGITSTVVLEADDLVAIHVGFFHKHGGNQFWRYYRLNGGQWARITWAKLSDGERQRVLAAFEKRAPSFANVPGKLRASYQKPVLETRTTYKIVKIVDGKYYSVHDGATQYTIGKRLAQRALDDHVAGFFSYPDANVVLNLFHARELFRETRYSVPMELALLKCEISGTMINYDGKICSTYIKPVRELSRFQYTPVMQEAC